MKITKHDLIALINEVLEEDSSKFDRAIETLRKKQQLFNISSRKIGVDIAKQELLKKQDQEKTASDALDAAEARGEDTSKEQETLNAAETAVKKATDGVTAANNSLKAAQKGGPPS